MLYWCGSPLDQGRPQYVGREIQASEKVCGSTVREYGEPRLQSGMRRAPAWDEWDDWEPPSSRRKYLIAGSLALLLLCGLGAGVWAVVTHQAQDPIVAVRAFCAALASQRYDVAYTLLAPNGRGGETAAQWAADARLHDTIDGRVTRCVATVPSGNPFSTFRDDLGIATGALATVPLDLTMTRARLGPRSGTLNVWHVGNAWKIKTVPDALPGTTLGPLKTMQGFCQALAAANYAQAYSYLSARQVALEKSPAAFAQQATPPPGAKYAGCAPNYAAYTVRGSAASIALAVNFTVSTASGNSTIAVHGTATFVLERGAWRLDGLDLGNLSS